MGRNRFITPSTIRVPLSDEDWIELKTRLTLGEEMAISTAGLTGVNAEAVFGAAPNGASAPTQAEGNTARIDMTRFVVDKIYIWLTDWSFRNADDKPVKITREAIRALEPDTGTEILAAIDAHVAAREEEKKGPTTTTPARGTRSP